MILEQVLTKVNLFRKFASIATTIIHNEKIVYNSFDIQNVDDLPIYKLLNQVNYLDNEVKLVIYNNIECYGLFRLFDGDHVYQLIIGPVLTVRPQSKENMAYLSFYSFHDEVSLKNIISMTPQFNLTQFSNYLELFYYEISGNSYKDDQILNNKENLQSAFIESINVEDFEIEMKNPNVFHNLYQDIYDYNQAICDGDVETLNQLFEDQKLVYLLSTPNLQLNLYNYIAVISIFGYNIVEIGIDFSDVQAIGGTFIELAEGFTEPIHFIEALKKLAITYAQIVHRELIKSEYPKAIKQTIRYIEKHIHYSISLEDISAYVHLSRPYLSQLFRKEVGESLQNYIQRKKIEESRMLLMYTKLTISEISQRLSFCSQSYYTEVFKRYEGRTPLEFRKQISNQ